MTIILPELSAMDAALRLGAATLAGAALGLNREIRGRAPGCGRTRWWRWARRS
ncbi:hypothetical protein [Longimicrobium terrae]|uniref:Putative membrane protein YhiD involved in acid resistance n=1 Tax=Longimicrobium terrae TaxID=1639882 RepID=A0A841GW07_9BACT|nr:hypothetical protein [Longimicrobium terrae]MBB4635430.1 putative membrane protein YhiD involved in acid resistance [Longimicrobium terrae]MBB6069824.1 putative membrane protein YhiD involved in acid resistance [Longimicrobium terrae]